MSCEEWEDDSAQSGLCKSGHDESILPIILVRGCLEQIRKHMQGDRSVGRGSRKRRLDASTFGNPFKVAVRGTAETARRFECMPREDDKLPKKLPQLSGTRIVLQCRLDQACHVDSIISVYRDMFPEAYDRGDEAAAAAPSAEVVNRLCTSPRRTRHRRWDGPTKAIQREGLDGRAQDRRCKSGQDVRDVSCATAKR